eukprot:c4452_g1_i1.p1 GENE.c4452_g1_i1~~c4452_g1_i1.p1  ORF type:complete len:120 (+),score=24.92 c4452_g1_i1:51-410(+)
MTEQIQSLGLLNYRTSTSKEDSSTEESKCLDDSLFNWISVNEWEDLQKKNNSRGYAVIDENQKRIWATGKNLSEARKYAHAKAEEENFTFAPQSLHYISLHLERPKIVVEEILLYLSNF